MGILFHVFLGSSAAERRPVKAMVVGSIPTRGADAHYSFLCNNAQEVVEETMAWEKHVVRSSSCKGAMTDALLDFLNKNKIEPGRFILREEEFETDDFGLVRGSEPKVLTILVSRE